MRRFGAVKSKNFESPLEEDLQFRRRDLEIEFLNSKVFSPSRPKRNDVKKLVRRGEFGVARHLVLEWMKIYPNEEWGFETMALIESYEGDIVSGWMWCANLLDKFPENEIGLNFRKIRESLESRDFEKTTELIDRILDLDEDNLLAIISRAMIYSEQGKKQEAANCWEELITSYHLTEENRENAAKALYFAKRYEKVHDYLIEISDEKNRVLKELLIRTEYNLGLNEECVENSDVILFDHPKNEIALKLKSRSLLRMGKFSESIVVLSEYCSSYPNSISAWESLIEAHLRMDKIDDAMEIWVDLRKKALEGSIGVEIVVEIALIFHWTEECTDFLNQLDRKIRNDPLIALKIASVFLKVGDIGKSWGIMEKYEIEPMETDLGKEIRYILDLTNSSLEEFAEFDNHDSSVWIPELVTREIIRNAGKRRAIRKGKPKCHIISSSLNRGGAERQVALTMKYISREEKFDCSLAVHNLENNRGLGTYLDDLSEVSDKIFDLNSISQHGTEIEMGIIDSVFPLLELFNSGTKTKIIQLISHFSEHSPDLVHAWQDDTIFTSAIAAAITGVPVVIGSARSIRPDQKTSLHIRKRPYLRNCLREIFRYNTHYLSTNSNAGKESYSEWIGVEEKEIFVIENGIDFEELEASIDANEINYKLQKMKIERGDKVIGGVFRLEPGKRPELWLETFRECLNSYSNLKGIIVGGGRMQNSMQQWIEDAGLTGSLFLIGESTDIAGWLEIMDLFLFTSSAEGLPNVLIEAQGFGLPVISTNVGGVKEVVIDGETGFLDDSSSSTKLADLITGLLKSEEIEKIRQVSKKKARKRFSIDSMIGKTTEMYSLVVSSE